MTLEEVWESIKAFLLSESLWTTLVKIFLSLVLLFISFKIINAVARKIEKSAEKKNADKTIMKTLAYILRLGLKIVVVIALVGDRKSVV